ncbi:MAG: hypothetical protein MJB57_11495 [Gemmatimonadetes bacterium]|nr:hypothetical protein [Gemmatimonadota bacterium]
MSAHIPVARRPCATPLRGPLLLVAGLFCSVGVATGQAISPSGTPLPDDPPAWLSAWSPLRRSADLPRRLPSGVRPLDLLTSPTPRVGEFWTAGNPGALRRELDDRRAEFRATLRSTSGTYARPLDPGGIDLGGLSTQGWTRLGTRGAAIGGAAFDRTSLRDSLFADVLLPYGSNPFVVADTSGAPMRRSAVRLEGALGWTFGRLGAGFALGWQGQSNRTVASATPRLNRVASPGFSAGFSYDVGGLRLGAFGRLGATAEIIQLQLLAQPTRIFQIEGYEEPIPLDLTAAFYERRFERTSYAIVGTAAFRVAGGAWAIYMGREGTSEDQFLVSNQADAPRDRWDADGWSAGLAAQWTIGDGREPWLLTVGGDYRSVSGDAFQASIGGILFEVEERRLFADAELRGRLGSDWLVGARARLRRSTHDRVDRLVEASSDITATEAGGSIEVGRMLTESVGVALGGQLSTYGPSGTLPDPSTLGPVYRRFVGPELALQLTEATHTGGSATIRWRTANRTAVWARAVFGSLSPDGSDVPLAPSGSRRDWIVTVGVTLDEGRP